jgi:hypothetical protein
MCAIGSSALVFTLSEFKIRCRLVIGKFRQSDHCWVETRTHIIDITATQFGNYDKILIFHKSDLIAMCLYKENKRLKPNPDPKHRFWQRWVKSQRPSVEKTEYLTGKSQTTGN